MKLILDNEFTWDGIYGVQDEDGKQIFAVDARVEDGGRVISVVDEEEHELGLVRQRRMAKRPEYEFFADDKKVGTISRRGADYEIKFIDWFVSGNIVQWSYRVVDKYGDIAQSCAGDDRLGIQFNNRKNALGAILLMLGLAGLAGDLVKEYSGEVSNQTDLHDAVDVVENIAGKASVLGHKTMVALEKLYGVYDGPEEEAEYSVGRKANLHDFVDGVGDIADKASDIGRKTMTFLDKLYGLDEKQPEDEARKE